MKRKIIIEIEIEESENGTVTQSDKITAPEFKSFEIVGVLMFFLDNYIKMRKQKTS